MSTVERRTLLKGAAIVGGTAWAAPVVESFAYKAAAASKPPVQHACCQCYDTSGKFIGAGSNEYTDDGCRGVCAGAEVGVSHGTFLRFFADTSFTDKGVTESGPGCYFNGFYLVGLPGENSHSCPTSGMPSEVMCDSGTF
jgi:hypothetical protein